MGGKRCTLHLLEKRTTLVDVKILPCMDELAAVLKELVRKTNNRFEMEDYNVR